MQPAIQSQNHSLVTSLLAHIDRKTYNKAVKLTFLENACSDIPMRSFQGRLSHVNQKIVNRQCPVSGRGHFRASSNPSETSAVPLHGTTVYQLPSKHFRLVKAGKIGRETDLFYWGRKNETASKKIDPQSIGKNEPKKSSKNSPSRRDIKIHVKIFLWRKRVEKLL